MVDSDLAIDSPKGTIGRNPEGYLVKLREVQSILVQTTQDYLIKHQRKRSVDGDPKARKGPSLRVEIIFF